MSIQLIEAVLSYGLLVLLVALVLLLAYGLLTKKEDR
jgi:hypothetical protein